MLESGDKSINEIQQIPASVEAKFLSKGTTRVIRDPAIMFKGKNSGYNKRKAISKDRYFNCQKLSHWGRDCKFPMNQYQSKKTKPEDTPKNQQ